MTTATMTAATIDFLLAFADDEHLMGQHHTEWIGVTPFLEEDLAFSSIGQDELGHAVALYEVALELQDIDPTDTAIDTLAYRPGDQYRSCAFTEYVTTDWAQALVRHWIYDTFEEHRWSLVADSSIEALRHVCARAGREETYHRRHANALVDSLLADDEARHRLLQALEKIVPLVPSLMTPAPGENDALTARVTTGSQADIAPDLFDAIGTRFGIDTAHLSTLAADHDRTTRSQHFGPLMSRMREVLDYDPHASW